MTVRAVVLFQQIVDDLRLSLSDPTKVEGQLSNEFLKDCPG